MKTQIETFNLRFPKVNFMLLNTDPIHKCQVPLQYGRVYSRSPTQIYSFWKQKKFFFIKKMQLVTNLLREISTFYSHKSFTKYASKAL